MREINFLKPSEASAPTLPRRADPCFDAGQVLQGAIEQKLKLEAATLAALGYGQGTRIAQLHR